MTPKELSIQMLIRLVSSPYHYSRRDLEQLYGISKDTVEDYLRAFRNVGLHLDINDKYRYAVIPDGHFKELKYLQPLSDADKAHIGRALDYLPAKDKLYLKNKLDSLYDFQQLGLRSLTRPALERLDRLHKAQREKRRVVLENYRSRSNDTRNRIVEPFKIDAEKDTLQAFDIEAKDSRHYRLSRIERVTITDDAWAYESHHREKITDVFRIADNDQVQVQLTVDAFAYNSLVEEFPLTLSYLQPDSSPNSWFFQCAVNRDFKGILNFIMANAGHVKIHAPDELRSRACAEAENILKKFQ